MKLGWFLSILTIAIAYCSSLVADISEKTPQPLLIGEQAITGIIGDKVVYQFTLHKDQPVLVEVKQLIGDLLLELHNEKKELVLRVNIPVNNRDKETMLVETEQCTVCLLSVLPVTAKDKTGHYTIAITPLTPTNTTDTINAERLMTQAASSWATAGKDIPKLEAVLARYQQAISIWRSVGNKHALHRALFLASMVNEYLHNDTEQEVLLQQLLKTIERDGNTFTVTLHARVLLSLGLIKYKSGQSAEAGAYYQRAKSIAEQQHNTIVQATTLELQGFISGDAGNQHQASQYFEQAYQLYTDVGDLYSMGATLNNLGWSYHRRGEQQAALKYYFQAYELAKMLESDKLLLIAKTGLGTVYGRLGDIDESLRYLNQVLNHKNSQPSKLVVGNATQAKAKNLLETGSSELALHEFETARHIYRELSFKNNETDTLYHLGKTHSRLGQYEQALDYYKQVLAYDRSSGNQYNQGLTHNVIAEVLMKMQQYAKASLQQKKQLSY